MRGTEMKSRSKPMSDKRMCVPWSLAFVVLAACAGTGRAEPPAASEPPARPVTVAPLELPTLAPNDSNVIPASGCTSCGTGGPGATPRGPGVLGWGKYPADPCLAGGCGAEGCGEAGCVPGRPPCTTCESDCHLGRLLCAFHN